MISTPLVIALLSAGISLAMGLVSLISGLHKDGEKTDLFFGILCISIFLFFVLPPLGFIITDKAPYTTDVIAKRFFNHIFFGLFPWFAYFYTGYKKKIFPLLIDALYLSSYLTMIYTVKDRHEPIWVIIATTTIGLTILHGFMAVRYQFKFGDKSKARWFQMAMIIFMFIWMTSTVYQIWHEYLISILHTKIFFPINLFPLAFFIIMGVRLRTNSMERFRLEKALGLKNLQWESLLTHIQLMVVHLDTNGIVQYINPYGINMLHYPENSEILGKNWFDGFMLKQEAEIIKSIYHKVVREHRTNPHYKTVIIRRRDGKGNDMGRRINF